MKKKLTAILLALMTITSCSSVKNVHDSGGGEGGSPDVTEVADSHELVLTNSFKKERLPISDEFNIGTAIYPLTDIDAYMIEGYDYDKDDGSHYLRMNSDFSAFTEINIEVPDEVAAYDFYGVGPNFAPDGTSVSLVTMEDHGGLSLLREPDGFFDYEAYEANRVDYYGIATHDADGKLLSFTKIDLDESMFTNEGFLSCSEIAYYDGSIVFSTHNGLMIRVTPDGQVTQLCSLDVPEDQFGYVNASISFHNDRDGNLLVETVTEEEETRERGNYIVQVHKMYRFDPEKGLGDLLFTSSDLSHYNDYLSFAPGRGEYILYMCTYASIYGIKEDGTATEVLNWTDSDSQYIQKFVPYGETDFVFLNDEFGASTGRFRVELFRFTPRSADELGDVKIVTFGGISNAAPEVITKFNASQTEYRIKVMDYGSPDPNHGYENLQLHTALISGNTPDVIGYIDIPTYRNLSKKGVFADLYEYMENDDEMNRQTVLPNVLRAMESSDGKLYAIFPNFDVHTLVTRDSVWNKESWTMDEMIALHDNAPDTAIHKYDSLSKMEMFEILFRGMTDVIDYENATCDLQCDEFRNMMEFCNRFADEAYNVGKDDWNEFEAYWADKWRWFADGKTLMKHTTPTRYNSDLALESDGEEMTFAGYPSNNGKGSRMDPGFLFAITANCKEKEGAWAFLKFALNYEYPSDGTSKFYSIFEDKFAKNMDYLKTHKGTASGNPIPVFTEEQAARVEKYVRECDTLDLATDYDVERICKEEATLYFGGVQNLDDTLEHMQNRVAIIISEKS